jgi:drug/metabolite transporter (DMT)-like permease
MDRSRIVAVSLVITIGVLWGLNWPAVKFVLGTLPPWTFRSLAFGLGGILLAVIARMAGEPLSLERRHRWPIVAASLLTVFGFNLLTAFGQLLTETSKAAIIAFTMPMWAALMSAAFLGERIGINKLVSLTLGMGGLAVLLFSDSPEYLEKPAGFIVMLGAAVSWAAGTVLLKARDWPPHPIARSAWLVGISALPAMAGAIAFEHPWTLEPPPPAVITVMAFHVIGPVAICYAAWTVLIARLPASTAAIATLLIPVVGVLSSSVLIGDQLTPSRLAALGMIVASVAFVLVRPFRRSAA